MSTPSWVRLGTLAALGAFPLLVAAGCSGGGAEDASATEPTPQVGSGEGACDASAASESLMMWDPVRADEMVTAECPWPYLPFLVPLDGGEDSPELSAVFEPKLYAELWTVISESGMGVCSVRTELDGPGQGRAFGFTYEVGPAGCPGAEPTGALVVNEYGTEAQRDSAALDLDGTTGERVLVLGRWAMVARGDAGSLVESLVDQGGQVLR